MAFCDKTHFVIALCCFKLCQPTIITKCCSSYCKMRSSPLYITKCVSSYKLPLPLIQNLQVITKCVMRQNSAEHTSFHHFHQFGEVNGLCRFFIHDKCSWKPHPPQLAPVSNEISPGVSTSSSSFPSPLRETLQ